MELKRLERQQDVQVAQDSTDIRGWRVVDQAGVESGSVDGLLYAPEDCHVRYAIVNLGNRLVLVPVGQVDINEKQRRVVARNLTLEQLRHLPLYDEKTFNQEEERTHFRSHVPAHPEQAGPDYQHPTFRESVPKPITLIEEQMRIDKHWRQIGEFVATKRPVTESFEQDLPLNREHVEVERRPVNRPATGQERVVQDGDVIRVPVIAEEIVTEKRRMVKEELIIRKITTRETQTIREDLVHEEVDFSGLPPTKIVIHREEGQPMMAGGGGGAATAPAERAPAGPRQEKQQGKQKSSKKRRFGLIGVVGLAVVGGAAAWLLNTESGHDASRRLERMAAKL